MKPMRSVLSMAEHRASTSSAGNSHFVIALITTPAQFVEMAAFQNVWIWPEPLPPTETSAVRQVLAVVYRVSGFFVRK